MEDTHVNENVDIVVLPSATRATYAVRDSRKIQQAVKSKLLLTSMETYHKVHVTVKHRPDGSPQALHVYMLRAYTYTADIARLIVDANFNVRSVDTSYAGDEEEALAARGRPQPGPIRPRPLPDMVFGTPVPEIPTAKAGVDYAAAVATAAGYKVVKLLGPNANLANYKKYLGGHLKAFGSIGHGYTGGIVLSDGNLTSTWVSSLPRKALSPEVVYFNSCQVFNPPLQPAIMRAGARTFVGGKVNLLIGPSEEVFKCFWTRVLKAASKMGDALRRCEKDKYPTTGAHGIGGDLGKF
jgi:hypothetical protein